MLLQLIPLLLLAHSLLVVSVLQLCLPLHRTCHSCMSHWRSRSYLLLSRSLGLQLACSCEQVVQYLLLKVVLEWGIGQRMDDGEKTAPFQ